MRIAHVTMFYPPAIGGAETCVYHLATEQARQGHDVSVITNSLPGLGRRSFVFTRTIQEELDDVKIYRLNSFIFRLTPIPLSLVSYLSRMDFDVIHLHLTGFVFQPEAAALLAKMKHTPLVSHVHIDPMSKQSWTSPYVRLTFQLSLALSKAIIVPTKNFKRIMLVKYRQDKKVVVIPNGIDTSLFKSQAKKAGRNDEVVILFVGRIVHQKGLDRLIAAMKSILEHIPNAKLAVVGSPNTIEMDYYRHLLRMVNELNLGEHVRFLGALPDDKLQEIRGEATLLVAPSRFESFGIGVLEALASGLPVVASDIPEFNDITSGSALLVDPTPQNLSNAIVRMILEKDLREKMINDAIIRSRDFLWSNINKQVLSLYSRNVK